MNKPTTVYFDTSFYIHLGDAGELLAGQITHRLNHLNVRYVLSELLRRELLHGDNRTGNDAMLVSRLSQLIHEPYCTGEGLTWEGLSHFGQERVFASNLLLEIQKMMTFAHSLSLTTDQDLTPEKRVKLDEALKPMLKAAGLPENFRDNMQETLSAFKTLFERVGIEGLDFPDEITPENAQKVLEEIKVRIGHDRYEESEEGRRIRQASTRGDNRPYEVVINAASPRTIKRLGSTYNDVDHINTFVTHRSEIDFLQVDGKHLERIDSTKPAHRIIELGLRDRIFAADNLSIAVDKVEELIKRQ